MDSLTHIYFAHKLLNMTGRDPSASVCSLFPQIDREPAYFHRMFGHPFFQISRLAEIGRHVYKTGEIQPGCEDIYEWTRFQNDRVRMKRFVDRFERETGFSISNFDPDLPSVLLSYVSHTYQDIFNNPMQAFLPLSVYPSGKWELWSELDPIEFRTILYTPDNIKAFREEFFGNPLWTAKLDGSAVIKAMINRTAVSSIVQLPRSIVEQAFKSFSLENEPSVEHVKIAEAFLIEHEVLLSKLIRKYSKAPIMHSHRVDYPVIS